MSKMFKPTYLLIMEHNITGLKYFCKTTMRDRLHRYKGSGVAWNKHLKEFGREVTVKIFGFYTDGKKCFDDAIKFSTDNDIVNSKEWANMIPETGKNGASNLDTLVGSVSTQAKSVVTNLQKGHGDHIKRTPLNELSSLMQNKPVKIPNTTSQNSFI